MILVTGATGFLGKRVCRMLESQGKKYYRTSSSLGSDLRDETQTFELFEKAKPEYVLHCASYVGGIQFGLKHTGEMFRNNTLMSINMLEACRKYKVRRLVNPISNCVYPGEATLFKEEQIWNGPLHDSVLVYGMVRKMSYIGAVAYQRQYGIDTVNLILSNMYGPEDHFEEERSHALGALIMKFVAAKKKNDTSVCVWGSGTPIREWLHVDDGATAMIMAMDIGSYIEPINIGVAKGISIKDMALLIKKIVGYEGDLVFDTTKLDGAPYKTVDGTLGGKLLGWVPEIDFEQGVADTIQWYVENKENRL